MYEHAIIFPKRFCVFSFIHFVIEQFARTIFKVIVLSVCGMNFKSFLCDYQRAGITKKSFSPGFFHKHSTQDWIIVQYALSLSSSSVFVASRAFIKLNSQKLNGLLNFKYFLMELSRKTLIKITQKSFTT